MYKSTIEHIIEYDKKASRHTWIFEFLKQNIEEHSLILDCGCHAGGSLFPESIRRGLNYIGVDKDYYALKYFKQKNPHALLVCSDFANLPLCFNKIDIIVFGLSLEYSSNPYNVLSTILNNDNFLLFIATPGPGRYLRLFFSSCKIKVKIKYLIILFNGIYFFLFKRFLFYNIKPLLLPKIFFYSITKNTTYKIKTQQSRKYLGFCSRLNLFIYR